MARQFGAPRVALFTATIGGNGATIAMPTGHARYKADLSMAFDIRRVRPADYEALGDVTADVYAVAYPPIEEVREAVRKMHDVAARVAESETTFVAVQSETGKIRGGVSFLLHDNKLSDVARVGEGEIRLLAVDPAARGQGMGRALVQACLDRASELGLKQMVLSTQEDMVDAQRL
jgi:ribosomal protein S18 acetylase RimI-like enzyme